MQVVVRADSSARIGIGHLARCHTLARELRERGATVRFVCRSHPGDASDRVRTDGFEVIALATRPSPTRRQDDGDYAAWLGVSGDVDAAETLDAMGATRPDWIIVDHYALDADWERRVRVSGARILVIDDLANRSHAADALLDQNWFGEDTPRRYSGLIDEQCLALLGPQFALLRPEFGAARRRVTACDSDVQRIFVYFGADPDDMTMRTLDALETPPLRHLLVDVVISASHARWEAIEQIAVRRGGVTLHRPQPHLADLMATADVAIGAGGATTWERMCLGLPSLVVIVAQNQVPVTHALERAGLITLVGDSHRVSTQQIAEAIEATVQGGRQPALRKRLMEICDGRGTQRVADFLTAQAVGDARVDGASWQ